MLAAAYQPYLDQGIALPDVTDGLDLEIEEGRVWVVTSQGAILGLLNLSTTGAKAHLINVAVSPDARGKGVGGMLIRHAMALAGQQGCVSLDLATHRDLTANISLYEHLGWRITGQDETRVFMSLVL